MLEEGNATERVPLLPEQAVCAVENHAVLSCHLLQQVHLACSHFRLDQLITYKPESYLQINYSTLCNPFKNMKAMLLENTLIHYLR